MKKFDFWEKYYSIGCVLFVGYGDASKGSHIASIIAKRLKDIPFIFIGNNIKKDTLKSNVLYIHKINNLCDIFTLTKVLIVPSLCNEAFGRVVVEAHMMHRGIKVITSNRGGLPETKPDLILDTDDLGSWYKMVRRYYESA